MDEANPQGMPRPRLARKAGGTDPSYGNKRPMLSVQGRNRRPGAGVGIDGKPWGTMAKDTDPTPARGISRPNLKLKTMDDIYGEPDDGLDVPDFVKPKSSCNCTGPNCSCG
jgi:hypothetical protein